MHRFIFPLFVLPIFAATLCAQPRNDLVKAQLLADVSSVKLGEPFTVGILLKIAPHYHVYWTNPGDSGQATSVELKAFPNSTVEQLSMPTPFRIELPGGLVNYGYENEVMLLARVSPHVNPKLDTKKMQIEASVSWLVCDENACIPGDAKISLSLPIADQAKSDNVELFKKWRDQIPTPAKGDAEVDPPPSDLKMEISWPSMREQPYSQVQWFPGTNDPLIIKDVKVTPSDSGVRVDARVELPAGQKLSRNTIDSVLGYTDSKGARRGLSLSVPIKH